jgi:hypothetical protein
MTASKRSPRAETIWYEPCIEPIGVCSGQKLVYSKASPGPSTGCSPTTPGPFTFSTLPSASVMIHSRLTSWTVSSPSFEIRTR